MDFRLDPPKPYITINRDMVAASNDLVTSPPTLVTSASAPTLPSVHKLTQCPYCSVLYDTTHQCTVAT